jgi:hypothetical protein
MLVEEEPAEPVRSARAKALQRISLRSHFASAARSSAQLIPFFMLHPSCRGKNRNRYIILHKYQFCQVLYALKELKISLSIMTTTLPYVNGRPHLGYALEAVQADVLARTARARGNEVVFNIGTDEHGQKIFQKAAEEGVTPLEYCDRMSGHFRVIKETLDVRYTHFIRTTIRIILLPRRNFGGDVKQPVISTRNNTRRSTVSGANSRRRTRISITGNVRIIRICRSRRWRRRIISSGSRNTRMRF